MNAKFLSPVAAAAILSIFGTATFAQAQNAAASLAPPCASPTGANGCLTSIQAAINAAAPGATIKVYPGNYDETAAGSILFDGSGPYQFGLFISKNKSGITVQGVDDKGKEIKEFNKIKAIVTTNSTSNFGPSGIFVEGDDVTIAGLNIGANSAGQNKTIEVIGDDFTLANCDISDLGGSVYFGDFRFNVLTNTSYIKSYAITGNNFQDGVSLDIANGAGFSGKVQDRQIKKNTFANSNYWATISFNGSDTGVPWFVYSVGGAVITDNNFTNTFTWSPGDDPLFLRTEAHIRARGTYDNSQFNWDQYFNSNKFDQAYATGAKPPKDLRVYSYPSGPYYFNFVRRIGALLQGEQAIPLMPGEKTVAKPK